MDSKLHILQHALGVDQHGRGRQYRNHFVTGEGSSDFANCRQLVTDGLMTETPGNALSGGASVFRVTPDGVNYVATNSPPAPVLTRGQRRYRSFLNARDVDCRLTFREWLQFDDHGVRRATLDRPRA